MKRIIISVIIIAAIIAAGCFAIVGIEAENTKIYGAIEEVLNSDSQEEAEMAVGELEEAFQKYSKRLSCIVDEDLLEEMEGAVYMLRPMLLSNSDEFTAQCELLRSYAKRVLDREIPTLGRIL
ncbi:MAG: DUF4363 family protein [Oscillospiraceae bacterium]|nr:DUF4363 family protein [Ruminococcus sp.]MCD8346074.1 DUF4363 family protein [Oscillospiraceae bacterium]